MKKLHVHLLFTVATLLLLMPGLNMIQLFDWDELNFAESAREMVESKNWLYVQIGYEPFFEKPPLFIWLQAIFYSLGKSTAPWMFKMPNVIAAVIAVNFVYHVGDKLGKRMLGSFWSLTILLTFAPFIYWRSGIIDPVFNLFIVMALFQWYQITQAQLKNERSHLYYLLVGIYLGCAFLTKGPVAILIAGMVIFTITLIRSKWHEIFNAKIFLSFGGLAIVLALWILPLLQSNGSEFLINFIDYQLVLFKGQIPWHNQPWFYHIVVLFFLCFPASILALPHLFKNQVLDRNVDTWHLLMRSLFWIVLIVFSLATTKIIHYSSLCWWPLSYFGAYQIYLVHTNRWKMPYWMYFPLLLAGLVLILAFWIIPLVAIIRPIPQILSTNMDAFSLGLLKTSPKWHWTTLIPASLFTFWFFPWVFAGIIGRKPNPTFLFLISGSVALMSGLTLLPAVSQTLQGPMVSIMRQAKKDKVFLEAWYFKTYALYFHLELKPEDFNHLKSSTPLSKDELYPKQTLRRAHAMNSENREDIYMITKNNYTPDAQFEALFIKNRDLGGYILWKRK